MWQQWSKGQAVDRDQAQGSGRVQTTAWAQPGSQRVKGAVQLCGGLEPCADLWVLAADRRRPVGQHCGHGARARARSGGHEACWVRLGERREAGSRWRQQGGGKQGQTMGKPFRHPGPYPRGPSAAIGRCAPGCHTCSMQATTKQGCFRSAGSCAFTPTRSTAAYISAQLFQAHHR